MSILSAIRARVTRAPARPLPPFERVRPDYLRWDGLRRGWGMAVDWISGREPQGWGETATIMGFDPIRDPRVGDVFYTGPLASGRTLLWVVDSVEPYSDPADLYHATLSRIGYEDDHPLPPSTYVEDPNAFRFLRGG